MKSPTSKLVIRAALLLVVVDLTAQAGTITDNFNYSHNYLADGVTGTIWKKASTPAPAPFREAASAAVRGPPWWPMRI